MTAQFMQDYLLPAGAALSGAACLLLFWVHQKPRTAFRPRLARRLIAGMAACILLCGAFAIASIILPLRGPSPSQSTTEQETRS